MCLLCIRQLSGEGHFDHLPENAKQTLEQCNQKIQLEGEPDTLVAGCVNAITGRFVEREVDLTIPASTPIEVVRGGRFGEHWSSPDFLSQIVSNLYDSVAASYDRFDPFVRAINYDHSGGTIVYEDPNVGYGKKRKPVTMKVAAEHFENGLTNTVGGTISGRTYYGNARAFLDPKKRTLLIKRANGAEKVYQPHEHGHYYLETETLSSGHCVSYVYNDAADEFKVPRRVPTDKWIKNLSGKVMGHFAMQYRDKDSFKNSKSLQVWASNQTSVVYQFTNAMNCVERMEYRLKSVTPSNGVPIKYEWGVERETPTRKVWPEGRYLALRTYKPNSNAIAGTNVHIGNHSTDRRLRRIAAVGGPVGAGRKEHTTHSFLYDIRTKGTNPNTTTVIDAFGHRTVYAYDRSNRIHSIYPLLNGSPYITDRTYWGYRGKLRARALKDGGTVFTCTTYQYDNQANPTEIAFYGVLTGRRGSTLAFDEEGHLTKSDSDVYVVNSTFDKASRKLTENDGRKIIRYVPDGNYDRNKAQFICDCHGTIKERFFYSYDDNGVVSLEIHDDGSSESADDLTNVTVRHIKRIRTSEEIPVGFPVEISLLYLDLNTGEEKLLSRETRTYDLRGNMLTASFYDAEDQHAYTITRQYDSRNNLLSETDALGRETTWQYDANNNVVYEKRPGEPATSKDYDFSNRAIAMHVHLEDRTKLTHRYQYDVLGRKTAEISPYGEKTTYKYDFLGRMIASTQPNGEKTRVAYNKLSQPVLLTDSSGNQLKVAYNSRHKPIRMDYPNGTSEEWYYTLDGYLEEHVGITGVITRYEYDYKGRKTRKTIHAPDFEAPPLEHRWVYNTFHLLEETDATGLTTTYRYDDAGRLIDKSINGLVQQLEYDSQSRHYRTIERAEEGHICVETKVFDALSRVVEERKEQIDGTLIKKVMNRYDERGLVVETITEGADVYRLERFSYGQLGEQISHIDPNGDETHKIVDYLYRNDTGKLVRREQAIDPQGNIVETHYDIKGKPVTIRLFDAFGTLLKEEVSTYNAFGNRTQLEETITTNGNNPRHVITTWDYDWFGRLKARTDALGTAEQKRSEICYNNYGQKESVTKPDGTKISFTYDGFGRLSGATSSDGSIAYSYQYDERSRLIAVEEGDQATTRSYNSRNQLVRETLKNGLSIGYKYDSKDRPTQLELPDSSCVRYRYNATEILGIERIQSDGEIAYSHQYLTYNGDSKPTRMLLAGNAGECEIVYDTMGRTAQLEHPNWRSWGKYDNGGNLVELAFEDALGPEINHYTYDSQHQLIKEPNRNYQWDSQYNCVIKDGIEQQHNDLNQLLNDGYQEFRYDANGNLIEKGGVDFTYDAFDRLTSVESAGEKYIYTYDFQNRRISKECYRQEEGDWKLVNSERYLYTGDQEIGAVDADGVINQLRILGVGIGAEIGAAVAIELEDKCYVPLHNHIGHVSALIDQATGETAATYRYSAFGEEQFEDSLGNPWRYASKRKDTETGFVNFGRRYYSPQMMRWLTPDPIDRDGGPNIYAYVMNDPLTRYDEYGFRSLKDDYSDKFQFWGSENLNSPNFIQQISNMSGRKLLYEGILSLADAMYSTVYQTLAMGTQLGFGLLRFAGSIHRVGDAPADPKKDYSRVVGYHSDVIVRSTITGVNTNHDDCYNTGALSSGNANGSNINVFYYPTHGFLIDVLEVIILKLGIMTPTVYKYRSFLRGLIRDNPDALQVIEAHSKGAEIAYHAIRLLDQDEKNKIIIAGYGGARILPKNLCKQAYNYVSKRDPIPFISDLWGLAMGSVGDRADIKYLESDGYYFLDHSIGNDTYQRQSRKFHYEIDELQREILGI